MPEAAARRDQVLRLRRAVRDPEQRGADELRLLAILSGVDVLEEGLSLRAVSDLRIREEALALLGADPLAERVRAATSWLLAPPPPTTGATGGAGTGGGSPTC